MLYAKKSALEDVAHCFIAAMSVPLLENVAYAVHLLSAQTDGSQMVADPDSTMGVVGKFSQDWHCAP